MPVLAAIGGVLSIVLFVIQHRTSGPVVVPFTTDDWVRVQDTWELRIPKRRHGRKNPSSGTWRYAEDGWAETLAAPSADPDGNLTVRLKSGEPFDGQVRVS